MKKSHILAVLLSLSSICFAGQKSFHVTLSSPATVGGVQIPAGDYQVKVDGTTAVFTGSHDKTVSAAAKVATATRKFSHTSVGVSTVGGVNKVKAIEFGGSTTRLEFAD